MARSAIKLFHTGIIVEDLDEAMRTWGEALGLHWAPVLTSTVPLRGPSGIAPRAVRFTYSLEGPHHIELLEQIDATPYLDLTGGRRVHHLGYFTEDLRAAAADLEDRGFRMELSGVADDGGIGRATFHYSEQSPGMWIELVSHEIAAEIGGGIQRAAEAAGIPFSSPFTFEGEAAEEASGR